MDMLNKLRTPLLAMVALLLASGISGQTPAPEVGAVRVLILTLSDTPALKAKIESIGGTVVRDYEHLDIVVAEVPVGELDRVRSLPAVEAVVKEGLAPLPATVVPFSGRGGSYATSSSPIDNIPANFVGNIGDTEAIEEFAKDNEGSYLLNHARSNVRMVLSTRYGPLLIA